MVQSLLRGSTITQGINYFYRYLDSSRPFKAHPVISTSMVATAPATAK